MAPLPRDHVKEQIARYKAGDISLDQLANWMKTWKGWRTAGVNKKGPKDFPNAMEYQAWKETNDKATEDHQDTWRSVTNSDLTPTEYRVVYAACKDALKLAG